ncbi:protein kinase domain-containing protein [Compostimonas suwonensis]|uniref:non-specific serine/threonine protein kinase n=1 Tax=Compostimonas suwonensis TaxID=1048394 RepID=A0A2M9C041_9MICO|nr:protein kinase [Compostimonas suwonensis]PJJ63707.1 serine/threonine-protein kinase [Compostimonas suwonensis]
MSDTPNPEPPADLLGGRYRLGDLLGVGGSASVFVADDLKAEAEHDRAVAVKVLHPHLSLDEAAREAFFREARAAQPLHHENVAAVRGMGVHDGGGMTMAWIAFDLARGSSLSEIVDERGAFSPNDAVVVIDGVLRALSAAHALGIVHRDVSPSNVLLDGVESGVAVANVRLVDFGLADAAGRSTLGSDVLLSGTATPADGAAPAAGVIGNAHYMSPEQAMGDTVDERGDIYQVGALLYFLLTARTPYLRETTRQVMQAHVSAPPPVPSARRIGLPRSLDRVVTRAMRKEPAARYPHAESFRTALHQALPEAFIERDLERDAEADDAGLREAGTAIYSPSSESRTQVMSGRASTRPPDYLVPQAPAEVPAASAAPRQAGVAVLVFVLAIGVGAALLWGWGASQNPAVADPPATSAPIVEPVVDSSPPTPQPTATPTPTAPPAPAVATVPELGSTLDEARRALSDAGFTVGSIDRLESPQPADTILWSEPAAGASLEPGAFVHLTVASGANAVPDVVGLDRAAATALLESEGFTASFEVWKRADATSPAVSNTQPSAGAVLRLGTTVYAVLVEPLPSTSTPTPVPTTGPSDAPDPDDGGGGGAR